MNSRERVLAALRHEKPDRVPFDVGGLLQSGIHLETYARLRRYLGLPRVKLKTQTFVTQTAKLDKDFLERLDVDTRFVSRYLSPHTPVEIREAGNYRIFTDEWGCERRKPKKGGLYYDIYRHPLDVEDLEKRLKTYEWPDPVDPARFAGLRQEAKKARERGMAVVLGAHCAGVFEVAWFLRGMESFMLDLGGGSGWAEFLLDEVLELKMEYWQHALRELGEFVDIVNEADDVAGQDQLLISPQMYRQTIKPRHQKLFSCIKKAAPHVKLLLHSDGALRPLIPDLIGIGVDILNPVQMGCRGMDPYSLKAEFGDDICFWGGAVDQQHVLLRRDVDEIRHYVRRNMEALAPGGGWIFAADHIVQADVAAESFMAMWETWRKYGAYQ
ncbi:MAG: uroporphyrinogen decarboxylase family protein [bacterium]